MRVTMGPVVLVCVLASTPVVLAQDEPPTISVTEAYRNIQASAEADEESQESDEVTSMAGGPFSDTVEAGVGGGFGSIGAAGADQDSQISSFSIRGDGQFQVSGELGGGEDARVYATADSTVNVSFTVPVDAPFTLSGSFTATGEDNGFCLSQVGGGIAGFDPDGLPFYYTQFFDCTSPPEDAAFFFTDTAKANTTLTLGFDGGASVEGGDGFDILGTGGGSFQFVLDFGDRDGDGLLDAWEEEGIDFDGKAPPDIDLPGMGADPDVKDLFVEVDVMDGVDFDESALFDVEYAFSQAPAWAVDNYDDSAGIQLHLIVDGDRPANEPLVHTGSTLPPEFYLIKEIYFGSDEDQDHPNWDQIREAKLRIFRYCLIADTIFVALINEQVFGVAEGIPSNDFLVAAGTLAQEFIFGDDFPNALAGTFMHELGHTLGLRHDGNNGDGPNFKPNYLSVMNYAYGKPWDKTTNQGTEARDAWRLDYSRKAFNTLDESLLYEEDPLSGPSGRMILFNSAPAESPSKINIGWASAQETDWNFSTIIETTPYGLDISNLKSESTANYDVLESFSDWDRLWYHLSGAEDFDDRKAWPFASPPELGMDVATFQAVLNAEWVDQTALGNLIFEHGFEVGSTTAWSETVP